MGCLDTVLGTGVYSLVLPVCVHGAEGTLLVATDSTVEFRPVQGEAAAPLPERRCRWWSLRSGNAKAFKVLARDLIGATASSGRDVRVWSCVLHPPDLSATKRKRTRRLVRSPPVSCATEAAAAEVVALLRRLGSWQQRPRPPRLLVVINPYSGQGRAKHIYERHVAPVLAAAGLEVAAVETRRRGHAGELAAGVDLQRCDLLVLVGGDGTVFDALQGLLQRADWAEAARLPLCQVPGGSGNALAANCGLWSAVTAAHAICKGQRHALDIVSVLQPPGRRYFAFLSIVFGMVANLDRGTEHLRRARVVAAPWPGVNNDAPRSGATAAVLSPEAPERWMGGARFTVGLLQQILLRTAFDARVAFITPAGAAAAAAAAAPAAVPAADVVMHACANLCRAPPLLALLPAEACAKRASWGCPAGPPTPLLDALGPAGRVDPLDESSLPPNWRTLGPDKVALFAACNLPWLDFRFELAPEAGFDTGHLDLIYTRLVTRREGFEFMNHSERATHLSLPMCGFEKVSALVLEPVSKGTWLLLDGEEVAYERIYAEVHKGLCTVLVTP